MRITHVEKLTNERWLNLFAARYEHNGHQGRWVYASRKSGPGQGQRVDAVVMVPVLHAEGEPAKLVMIREFRIPINDYSLAFPAGLLPNLQQLFHALPCGLPRGELRGGAHAFQAFAAQCFLDEIAAATHQDPVVLRMDLLGAPRMLRPGFDTGRLAGVLRIAAGKIDWQHKPKNGHGLGIACHAGDGAYAAHAFEVSVNGNDLVIHRAVCAVDAGRVLNPLNLEAQAMQTTLAAVSAIPRAASGT